MTILRSQDQLPEATMADLVETYNALTGKSITRFESAEVGRRRVANAMLAATDRDGHTGVPANTNPEVKTDEEIKAKCEEKGIIPPPAPDSEDVPPTFPPGSMADQLQKAAASMTPPPKRERAANGEGGKKSSTIVAVSATFAGRTKLQTGSVRNNVMAYIAAQPDSCATLKQIDEHFATNTRGHVQKLIVGGHCVACPVEDVEKAIAEKRVPRAPAPAAAPSPAPAPAEATTT